MKIEEFINILRKLQTVGVDVSKMTQKDTTETLAKKSGISKEKLGEIGLEPTLKIEFGKTRKRYSAGIYKYIKKTSNSRSRCIKNDTKRYNRIFGRKIRNK